MIDPQRVPAVEPNELLARFVFHGSHIRKSNQTVKPDAFIPFPWPNLSVTRHQMATAGELWSVGTNVAAASGKTLHGRCDLVASDCLGRGLDVFADPVAGNPNHANISRWPTDKPAQKVIALELAALASFVPRH